MNSKKAEKDLEEEEANYMIFEQLMAESVEKRRERGGHGQASFTG